MKITNYVGTPLEATQKHIIRDNIAQWRRNRKNRQERVEQRDSARGNRSFNSIGSAMVGKRVMV